MTQTLFVWNFVFQYWDLFVIWDLAFGAYSNLPTTFSTRWSITPDSIKS
jgi:hypothetical protein